MGALSGEIEGLIRGPREGLMSGREDGRGLSRGEGGEKGTSEVLGLTAVAGLVVMVVDEPRLRTRTRGGKG